MRETLHERLQRARREGRVLDVSNIKEDGTGSLIMDYPGPRSSKVSIPELPTLVSSNYESYKLATELLGETYIKHAYRYYNTYVSPKSPPRAKSPPRSKSPGKKRPTSPKKKQTRSPGKKRPTSPSGKRPSSPPKKRPGSPGRK